MVSLLKQNAVLCIAGALAFCSMFLIPPSLSYMDYLDFRVLTLLFCLMIVVSGFQTTGLFDWISNTLLRRAHSLKQLSLILIFITFFGAMFITNDVALIAFVPLSILVIEQAVKENDLLKHKHSHILIVIVVLQTISANLGSMLTPIGNPQNLYLYSLSEMSLFTFFKYTAPLTALSFLLLIIACNLSLPKIRMKAPNTVAPPLQKRPLCLYTVLFLLCLLTVAHLLQWQILLLLVFVVIFLFARSLFKTVDYGLLATFVCFFIFIGNMGQLEPVKQFLQSILSGREIIVSALASQVISNVPASILLSGFTTSYGAILMGVNIGGLGTLIASLASLISWKQYNNCKDAKPSKYFLTFTAYNMIFFILMFLFALFIYHS